MYLFTALLLTVLLPSLRAEASGLGAAVVNVSSGNLNVRSGASTGNQVVATLGKGSYVTLVSRSGSWWKVEYGKEKYGYCHSDYLKEVAGTVNTVSVSGSLNVRAGAGTNYARTGSLYNGESVVVISTSNGWSRILYHGVKTGYVSQAYLKTSSAAIRLSVPAYSQTDSRWASVPIGTSGKTMAQIGCATTALAMMESHQTGTAVYPHTMAKQLRYTASGSVYWPSDLTAVTDSSDYLNRILNLLKQGKPVLYGAKNSSGGQHWVVIYGFTGESVKAENLLIHDPGSASRKTLGQFLSAYPRFYKYFYAK